MDLIDRQAAIDFIDAGHLVNPNEPRWSDNEVVNFLKSRPSAQPTQTNTPNALETMDCISRQAAIDAINHICPVDTEYDCTLLDRVDVRCVLSDLPSAQPEQSDASEFWRKRADYYSYMCLELISEMGKGVKIGSVKISENGLEFIKEKPSAQSEVAKDINVPNNDTVSRQVAIDALNSLQKFSLIDDNEYLHGVGVRLRFAIQKLEQLPPAQPEWIPCSERLPKRNGEYLITEKGMFGDYLYVSIANYGVPCMPMNKGKGRGWFITDSEGDYYCDMNYVLAWMPLTEPYKERRKE